MLGIEITFRSCPSSLKYFFLYYAVMRGDPEAADVLQRNVGVFLGRTGFAFAGQHSQGIDNVRTGLFRFDNRIDETTFRRFVQVRTLRRIPPVFWSLSGSLRKMIFAAPCRSA